MILKGLLKTQLLVHSYSKGILQQASKQARRGKACVTSILTSGCLPVRAVAPSAGMWNSPFQILTQARLQLQMPAAHAPFTKHSLKEIFKL